MYPSISVHQDATTSEGGSQMSPSHPHSGGRAGEPKGRRALNVTRQHALHTIKQPRAPSTSMHPGPLSPEQINPAKHKYMYVFKKKRRLIFTGAKKK